MSPLYPTFHPLPQLPLPPFFCHGASPSHKRSHKPPPLHRDILIKTEDVLYIQNSLNYVDGPARAWGLDMNVSKTEVHANGTALQKVFLTPRGSEFLPYNKKIRRPHTCYQYLGVYLFTHHQAKDLFHMLKAEIQSYFARHSPLPLTLSEKVRLTNSQLVPAFAYRLINHSLSPDQLEKLQSLVRASHAWSPPKIVSQLAQRED